MRQIQFVIEYEFLRKSFFELYLFREFSVSQTDCLHLLILIEQI